MWINTSSAKECENVHAASNQSVCMCNLIPGKIANTYVTQKSKCYSKASNSFRGRFWDVYVRNRSTYPHSIILCITLTAGSARGNSTKVAQGKIPLVTFKISLPAKYCLVYFYTLVCKGNEDKSFSQFCCCIKESCYIW